MTARPDYTPRHLADKILTSKSTLEGERKHVTVLFADVGDYTPLSERSDPEEMHSLMDRCFQQILEQVHRYEGTVNQFTGDGVMALFGAPLALEDAPVPGGAGGPGHPAALWKLWITRSRAAWASPSECASASTEGPSWWAGSVTICAWTTPPLATPRTSPPACSK